MNMTTMEPIADRIAEIERPRLRSIGVYKAASGAVDFAISWDDAARDAHWITTRLRDAGISKGDFVALVCTGHEAPWYQAVIDAVYAIGATICPLEPAPFEIGRAEMFFRRFPISSIIGLDLELGALLIEQVGKDRLLARQKLVLVRPEARELFGDDAAAVGMIAPIGPALGISRPGAVELEFADGEWRFDLVEGSVTVTALAERAHRPNSQALPPGFRVVEDARGQRIVLDDRFA